MRARRLPERSGKKRRREHFWGGDTDEKEREKGEEREEREGEGRRRGTEGRERQRRDSISTTERQGERGEGARGGAMMEGDGRMERNTIEL